MFGRPGREWLAVLYLCLAAAFGTPTDAAEGDIAANSVPTAAAEGYIAATSYDQQEAHASHSKSHSSSSVVGGMAVMFGRPDWQVGFNQGAPTTSACIQQVQRVASRMGVHVTRSSVKISPYFFYTWAMPSPPVPGEDKYYRHLVVRWLVRDASYKQVEPTEADVVAYITDFGKCVSTAIQLGFRHIFINPMVDPDYNQQDCCPWRNAAEFDPTEVLEGTSGGWSYDSLVLEPTLKAVIAAVQGASPSGRSTPQVSFGLGAEQGRSFTVFARKWETLANKVQKRLKGVVQKPAAGPHFDPTKLCGYYCDHYSNSTKVTAGQWADFRSFLSTAKEFGVSSYPNVWEQYDPKTRALDVAQSARLLDAQLQEFAQTGIKTLRKDGKRFIFNELGLGGCENYGCDGTSTPDIYQLSTAAYNGQGSYENYDTPPKLVDPFRYMWTKSFRMEWWRQTLQLLGRRSRSQGGREHVLYSSSTSSKRTSPYSPDAAYVWAVGSWDVAAIYNPSSKGQQPDTVGCDPLNSYCDPDILDMIKAFNREGAVQSSAMFALPGPAYYKAQAAQVRSRTVSPAAVALSADPQSVPGWAQPLLFARPVWG